MPAVALTIAGSDPSGGAGIQADLKTFHQFGVYGEAAITLLTVQNTRAVSRVEILPATLVREQIQSAIADITPAAAKTGALGSAEIVTAIAEAAASFNFPLIVDPVMISKHGARLMSGEAEEIFRQKLLPYTFLVTPNVAEAQSLTGLVIRDEANMCAAAGRLLEFGCKAVLVKGGHLTGEPVDVLVAIKGSSSSFTRFPGQRIDTRHTHGAGCTYSAAITAAIARGYTLVEAVHIAKAFIQSAIATAPNLGSGQGPLNHFATITEYAR